MRFYVIDKMLEAANVGNKAFNAFALIEQLNQQLIGSCTW